MAESNADLLLLTDEDLPPGAPPITGRVGPWAHYGFASGWFEGVDIPKPMEDALVVGRDGDRLVGFVADAHGGAQASCVAAEAVAKRLGEGDVTAEVLIQAALEGLDQIETEERVKTEGLFNQTTLLAAVADPQTGVLEVSSIGDSLCILLREGLAYTINKPGSIWAGSRTASQFLDREAWPEGTLPWLPLRVTIESEDRILVATDGVTEPIYRVRCVTEEDLVRLVDEPADLHRASDRLLQEVLRRDRKHERQRGRGGEDNVAFVLFEVPSD